MCWVAVYPVSPALDVLPVMLYVAHSITYCEPLLMGLSSASSGADQVSSIVPSFCGVAKRLETDCGASSNTQFVLPEPSVDGRPAKMVSPPPALDALTLT